MSFLNRKTISLFCASLLATGAQAQSVHAVRLMPIGDSITAGYLSSQGYGYRGPLFTQLTGQVGFVDFVGTQQGGSMADPDNEGHSGWRIDQIASIITGSLQTYRPNVVTLHIGTNDLNGGYQVDTAPARLAALIDQIIAAAPDATVLVATVITAANATTASRVAVYNAQVPGIVQQRANAGKHVRMVDMSRVTTADLADGLHPNDTGYQKMSDAWDSGIAAAVSAGWIGEPATVAAIPSNGMHHVHPANAPGMALDDLGSNINNGTPIEIWGTNGTGAQMWNFSDANVLPSGAFNIAVSYGPYCLTAMGGNSGSAVQLQACNGSAGQAWKAGSVGSGYVLHPANNLGLCLDVTAGGTANGTLVQAYNCNGTVNQRWTLN